MFSKFLDSLTDTTSSFINQTVDTFSKISYSGLFTGSMHDINCLRKISSEPFIYSLFTSHDVVSSEELKNSIASIQESHKNGVLVINLGPRPIMAENVVSFECRGYISVPLITSLNIVRTMKKFFTERSLYADIESETDSESKSTAIIIACKDNIQRAYIIACIYSYLDNRENTDIMKTLNQFEVDIMKYFCKSHIRYLQYVSKLNLMKKQLNAGKLKESTIKGPIIIKSLQIYNIPNFGAELFCPVIDIIQKNSIIYSESKNLENAIEYPKEENFILMELKEEVKIEGDFIVRIKHRSRSIENKEKFEMNNWVRFMVHTSLMIPHKEDKESGNCNFSLELKEIDEIGTHCVNKEDLKINIVFRKEGNESNVKEWVEMINLFNVLKNDDDSKDVEENIDKIMDELDMAESEGEKDDTDKSTVGDDKDTELDEEKN